MDGFGDVLREKRQSRHRISQSKLAELAGFDHSYVSRLETGARNPTREAVEFLADALNLDQRERAELLVAAGFTPHGTHHMFLAWSAYPVLGQLSEALRRASPRALCAR